MDGLKTGVPVAMMIPQSCTFAERCRRTRRFLPNITAFYENNSKATKIYDKPEACTPHVENPIQFATYSEYKAALRRIYNAQINNNVNSLHWDHVWLPALNELHRLVRSRKLIIKRLQHQEKVTGEFSPYAMVGHYNDIEDMLWTDSNGRSWRQTVANLRHRYCLLVLTSGILRCESLTKADLSDHLSFYLPQRDQDIHPMLLLIMHIPEGKVNNGRTLFGRATRHKLPQFCPVGALAMYLQCRFHVTREFNNFTIEDRCTNSRWFDIKLLVDVDRISDRTQPMRSDGYSKHIKVTITTLPSCLLDLFGS